MFYIAVFGQAASGVLLAWRADPFAPVFGAHGSLLPDFRGFPMRAAHYSFSRLLMALIALHVRGAAYHTFIRRDGLPGRSFFGRHAKQPKHTTHAACSRPQALHRQRPSTSTVLTVRLFLTSLPGGRSRLFPRRLDTEIFKLLASLQRGRQPSRL
jgi:hypothetical protein